MPDDQRAKIDQALAERVSELDVDTHAIGDAFVPVLADVPDVSLPAASANQASAGFSRWAMAACLITALALGWFANNLLQPVDQPSYNWHASIAEYQRLYTTDTLATNDPDLATVTQALKRISDTSGLTITTDMVRIPDLHFRRAQTLGLDGQPLIQLAFSTTDGKSVALCFMRNQHKQAMQESLLLGMNSVSWSNGEFGFIIIGDVPKSLLNQSAQLMASRLL